MVRFLKLGTFFGNEEIMVLAEYLRIAHFGFFQSHFISYSLILWGQSPFVIEMLLVQKKVIKFFAKLTPFYIIVDPCLFTHKL